MGNCCRRKTELPRLSVGESDTSPEDERKRLKYPNKNEREKQRVKAVAAAYEQLRTALGAGNENGRRATKVETLQAAVQFIQDLKEELAGLQLLRNESSDRVYPTEPLPTRQANLVRICARRCMLPRLLPFCNYEAFPLASSLF